jgi:hypothetical protein
MPRFRFPLDSGLLRPTLHKLWLVNGLTILALETWGVYRDAATLTGYARKLRRWRVADLPVGDILLTGLLCWLVKHFLEEDHRDLVG